MRAASGETKLSENAREIYQLIARLVDAVEEMSRRNGADEMELSRLHYIRVDALKGTRG
jgi:hypothetical protein